MRRRHPGAFPHLAQLVAMLIIGGAAAMLLSSPATRDGDDTHCNSLAQPAGYR
jgi:hypothetical protein